MLVSDGNDISKSGFICISTDESVYDISIKKILIEEIDSEVNEELGRYSVTIKLSSGRNEEIRINEVTNQPTWTVDAEGVEQAKNDIHLWSLNV